MSSKRRGLLFIVSAPSGAGKTTLVERLVEQVPNLTMSRSYTSRRAREGEIDGVDYTFVTRDHFEAMIEAGEGVGRGEDFGQLHSTPAARTAGHLGIGEEAPVRG